MTGTQAGDIVGARHWRRYGRGFSGHSAFAAAVRRELKRAGEVPVRADIDEAGNCTTCGECGRCPGWHAESEVRR